MAESMYNQQNINQKSTETPTEEDALGIKNPLLTPTTLGQNFCPYNQYHLYHGQLT